jgi:hypothetical protein
MKPVRVKIITGSPHDTELSFNEWIKEMPKDREIEEIIEKVLNVGPQIKIIMFLYYTDQTAQDVVNKAHKAIMEKQKVTDQINIDHH